VQVGVQTSLQVGAQLHTFVGVHEHKDGAQHLLSKLQQDGKQLDGVHPEGIQSAGKPQTGLQVGTHSEGIQSDGKLHTGEQISTDPHVIGAQQIGNVHTGAHNPPTTQDILLPTQHKNVPALQA
jgi:hypothetical protein